VLVTAPANDYNEGDDPLHHRSSISAYGSTLHMEQQTDNRPTYCDETEPLGGFPGICWEDDDLQLMYLGAGLNSDVDAF
jgi:hypothetical protein